jgi:hypothetical protein
MVSEMRPVLRRAHFGDVHAGHHLDAHRHRWPVRAVQRADLPQQAVDAITDAQEAGFRFEVDVGGAALDRIGQQRVDQAHHRLAVFVGRGGQCTVIDLAGFELGQDAFDRQFVAVGLIDRVRDFGLAGQYGFELDAFRQQRTQLVEARRCRSRRIRRPSACAC